MSEPTVSNAQALMSNALNSTRPATLLQFAAEQTAPKTGPWKGRRKLTAEETIAAMRVITGQIARFGLKPTVALTRPNVASEASATYKLFLTDAEMASEAVSRPKHNIIRNLSAHVTSVRLIARHAEKAGHDVAEIDLLDELAAAVPEFLEQFRLEQAVDEHVEVAADLGSIADWLASPHREIELVRFFNESDRQRVVFNPNSGVMEYEGYEGDVSDWNTPCVPLMLRVVAQADVEYRVVDPDLEPRMRIGDIVIEPGTRPIGRSHGLLAYKVGLGVLPDEKQRGACMAFTLDPVTYVAAPPPEGQQWNLQYSELHGFPIPGRIHGFGGKTPYVLFDGKMTPYCPLFAQHWNDVWDDDRGPEERELYTRRWIEVTPEHCRILLDEGNRSRVDQMLTFSGIKEESVLPQDVLLEGGVESTLIRDRLKQVLYAAPGEPSLADLLLEEATKRCRALEGHILRSASGERLRKLAFRSRMRR
jgi:hypothetical protein